MLFTQGSRQEAGFETQAILRLVHGGLGATPFRAVRLQTGFIAQGRHGKPLQLDAGQAVQGAFQCIHLAADARLRRGADSAVIQAYTHTGAFCFCGARLVYTCSSWLAATLQSWARRT